MSFGIIRTKIRIVGIPLTKAPSIMQNWEKVSAVVDQALDYSADERLTFINRTCAGDPELKQSVITFLESIDSSEGFFDKLMKSGGSIANELVETGSDINIGKFYNPPEQAGAYKIIRLIARGGMGNVFLAERCDGQFDRKVAIKVLRQELTSDNYTRRFTAERNILSGLEHPHIARLYDGGITEDNRPYLVMEYVDGLPISSYCRKNNCSLNEILDLFTQVCKAVKYAHKNLIVHRDLKPDNILVNEDGTVKILDFGIAKIINDELSPEALFETRENQQMLSLQYAAPEQITLEKITTATDVYSLGLLLYELITGQTPFDLSRKNLREVEHIIRNNEVKKPSSVLQDSALSKKVKGDLDAIILTSLEKEPEQRYNSVDQMMEDIERYRANRPIPARSGSYRYRIAKYVKRHPWAVAAGIATLLVLAGYIFTLLIYTERLEHERGIAQLEAANSAQIAGFVVMLFEANDPNAHNGEIPTVPELLERGVERAELLDDQPAVSARMLETIGQMYAKLGRHQDAEPLFRRAVELRRESNPEPHTELAFALDKLGDALYRMDYFDDAEQVLREGLDVAIASGDRVLEADILNDLGLVSFGRGNYEEAAAFHREALDIRREVKGETHHRVGTSLNNIALALERQFLMQEATEMFEEALAIKRAYLGSNNTAVTNTMRQLGRVYAETNRQEEAAVILLEALEINRGLLGSEHPRIAEDLNDIAAMYSRQGDNARAEELFREALTIREATLDSNSLDVALSLSNLATVKLQQGNASGAVPLYDRAVEIARERWGTDHLNTAIFILNAGSAKLRLEQYDEAEPNFRESIEMMSRVIPEDHVFNAHPKMRLGELLTTTGRYSEAEPLLRRVLDLRVRAESSPADIAQAEFYLGRTLVYLSRFEEAERLLGNSLEVRTSLMGEDHGVVQITRTYLDRAIAREVE
ncbi:MAG: serine/threonine-protein kinase [Balneolia bacterium]|nr:serine/threonine-protein kinase [Balneolia bacterium]